MTDAKNEVIKSPRACFKNDFLQGIPPLRDADVDGLIRLFRQKI